MSVRARSKTTTKVSMRRHLNFMISSHNQSRTNLLSLSWSFQVVHPICVEKRKMHAATTPSLRCNESHDFSRWLILRATILWAIVLLFIVVSFILVLSSIGVTRLVQESNRFPLFADIFFVPAIVEDGVTSILNSADEPNGSDFPH